jgi:Ran-binding protein 1
VTLVTPDMKLSPNIGSDRSWVWNVAADVSEGEPEAQTLAIRFLNSSSGFWFDRYDLRSQLTSRADANLFKEAFIKAQQENEKLFGH